MPVPNDAEDQNSLARQIEEKRELANRIQENIHRLEMSVMAHFEQYQRQEISQAAREMRVEEAAQQIKQFKAELAVLDTDIQRLRREASRGNENIYIEAECPYPGGRPYTDKDKEFFFGRITEIDILRERLTLSRQIFLTAPSGTGKSSLIDAGLLPRLAEEETWSIQGIRKPGQHPEQVLRDALKAPEGTALTTQSVQSLLSSSPPAQKILLVFDQFEELFNQPETEDWKAKKKSFFETLETLVEVENCFLLIVIRSDFLNDLQASPLWHLAENHLVRIDLPSGEALRQVLEKPAAQKGVILAPQLVERLKADVESEPGALVALQETMRLLWSRRKGQFIPLSAYEQLSDDYAKDFGMGQKRLSGLAVALSLWANEVFVELKPPSRQIIARRILFRLVQFGEGRPHTCRQQSELALMTAEDIKNPTEFREVLNFLEGKGLVAFSSDGMRRTVDLSHEMLVTGWPVLRNMVTDPVTRHRELQRRDLAEKARLWSFHGRSADFLIGGSQLKDMLKWARDNKSELAPLEIEYLAECEKQARHRRNLNRVIATAGIIILTLISLVGLQRGWFYILRQRALNLSPTVALTRPGNNSFSIDLHEVSNEQYGLCIQAEVCKPPQVWAGSNKPSTASTKDLPVTFVTAYQASEFCAWLDRRLPTFDQWVDAATDNDQYLYPTGNDTPTADQVNITIDGPNIEITPVIAPVVSFEAGRTRNTGLYHMLGNVKEWTRSYAIDECPTDIDCKEGWDEQSAPAARLLAVGQSWQDIIYPGPNNEKFAWVNPGAFEPYYPEVDVGFRCVSP